MKRTQIIENDLRDTIFSINETELNKIAGGLGTTVINKLPLTNNSVILHNDSINTIMNSIDVPNQIKHMLHIFVQFLSFNKYSCCQIVKSFE